MKIETRIIDKGEIFILKNGEELTPSTDLYFVIIKDGEKELVNRVFVDPIYAGDAVKSLKAFCRCLVQN